MSKLKKYIYKTALTIVFLSSVFIVKAQVIIGPTPVNSGVTVQYIAIGVNNSCNSSRVWTIVGGNIISGQYTSLVTVKWDCYTGGPQPNIKCHKDGCGGWSGDSQEEADKDVTVITYTPTADPIVGTDTVCEGTVSTYTTAAVTYATSYVWAVSGTAHDSIVENGTSVQVYWSDITASQYVEIKVTPYSGTCVGTASTDSVNVQKFTTIPFTTSTDSLCGGTQNVIYTVTPDTTDPNILSYNWTLPIGVNIVSGAGTDSITVDFDPYALSGDIIATAVYACGLGLSDTVAVSVTVLPYPPSAIQGTLAICDETAADYNINPVSNADSYTWVVVGGTADSTSTVNPETSITWHTPGTGTITVTPVNSCGNSPDSSTLDVIVHPTTAITIVDSVGFDDDSLTAQTTQYLEFNHCTTSNSCSNKFIDKATLFLTFNTGDDYNYGSNSFTTSTAVHLIAYGGLSHTGPVIIDDTINLSISQSSPEQIYQLDFTDDYYQIQSFGVEIISYTSSAVVDADIQLTAVYKEEFKYSVYSNIPLVTNLINTDLQSTSNQYQFTWSNSCPDFLNYEIQILRLFNNDPADTTIQTTISADVDWNEALAIETHSSDTNIILTLAEGTGYYVWRVRPIGNLFEGGIGNDKNWGLWSDHGIYTQGATSVAGTDGSSYSFFYDQFNDTINWIYSRTFTEGNLYENKQVRISENITFANGLQQARQTQAHLSTNDKILTTQTVNDFSGRPALSSMPVPLDSAVSLGFEPAFMKNSGSSIYTAEDFDADANFMNPDSVDDGSGEHFSYYSNNNTDTIIPNAEQYPFTRTLFYNDGNSRVKEQSGVGEKFRIKVDLSESKTNKTYYSGIGYNELIRVFGDEAPDNKSVHKVINIDGNNTATITYIGKDGKTLATCLARNGSNTLDSNDALMGLQSQDVAGFDVFDSINNTTPYGDFGNEAATSQTYVEPTTVVIHYDLTPKSVQDICLNYCATCDYFIEISVQDIEQPDSAYYFHSILLPSGICDSTNLEPYELDTSLTLPPGTYIFTKRVVANNFDPNTITGANPLGSTYYEMHLDSVRNAYDSLIYGVGGQLDTINGYLDTANIVGLYDYLGIDVDIPRADTVFQDSVVYIPIGCDSLAIPIIVCIPKLCPPQESFADYFDGFWMDSTYQVYSFNDISDDAGFIHYDKAEFDSLVSNMISDGYACDSLWDCWYSTVQNYEYLKDSLYANTNLPAGIINTFNIVEAFLDCAGRRIEGIHGTSGNPGDNTYAYKYFNYDGDSPLCEEFFVEQYGYTYPDVACQYDSVTPIANAFSCFVDSTWTEFYQCVSNVDPNSTPVADTNVYTAAQAITDTCEVYCELKKGGYIDAIITAFHQNQQYVAANPDNSSNSLYPFSGDIYTLEFDSIWNSYQFNDTILLDSNTTFIDWDEIDCMANSLVKFCKEGCTLTPVFDSIVTDSLISMGTEEEIAAYQNSFASLYEVSIPPTAEDTCDTGWETISSGGFSADTTITTDSIVSKFYYTDTDYLQITVVSTDTTIVTETEIQTCSQFDSTFVYHSCIDTTCSDTTLSTNTGYSCDTIAPCYNDWTKLYGGHGLTGIDHDYDFGKTADGGYLIVAASTSDSSGHVFGNHGGYDAWLVKTNEDGEIEWARSYGGSDQDFLMDFKQTPQGDYVLAGYSKSSDGDLHSNDGDEDYWVLKLDGDGDTLWSKSYGNVKYNKLYGITLGHAGGVIVVGEESGAGGGGVQYRMKLDDNGDEVWSNTAIGGTLYAVTKVGGGNYVAVGVKNSGTPSNYFIMKFDENGDTLWTKTHGNSATQFARDVHYYYSGGVGSYLVTGVTTTSDTNFTTHGSYDYTALMLDEQGNKIWSNTYGGSNPDVPALSTPLGNGFIITGTSKSTDGDVHQGSANFNHWITHNNWNGDTIFTMAFERSDTTHMSYFIDYGVKTELTDEGCYVVAGHVYEASYVPHQTTDIIVTKYCPGGCCEHRDFCFRYVPWPTIPDSIPEIWPITCEESAALDIADAIEHLAYEFVEAQIDSFENDYMNTCVNPDSINDNFYLTYPLGYHHYTLYYYNRAGSLIQTVPPQGVDLLDRNNAQDPIDEYTEDRNTSPKHRFITDYEYNSLGQLIKQNTPDGDTTEFFYNNFGQLRFSQNAQQLEDTTYSYTKYDALGRIIVVGESTQAAENQDFALAANVANSDFPNVTTNNSQVTYTVYTNSAGVSYLNDGVTEQRYLLNRISYTYTDEDGDVSGTTDDQTYTYYSYDPHGNVEWLIQDIPGFVDKQYVSYEYDLVSGNVLKVNYNEGKLDQFYHRYSYDADNRITTAETSTNNIIWEKDAGYEYYIHGPLARTAIGEDKVQGLDYVYTIHGWLKALNHASFDKTNDPGNDGTNGTNNFAKDVFAMQLGYFTGDFNRTGSPFNSSDASALNPASNRDLYNGNISTWASNNLQYLGSSDPYAGLTGYQYRYDELNRIRIADFKENISVTTYNDVAAYASNYRYDGNGNIYNLNRKGTPADLPMDSLKYYYYDATGNIYDESSSVPTLPTNKLAYVTDEITASSYTDDLESQLSENYAYDKIGNLIQDSTEEIAEIKWTVYGKIKEIIRTSGSSKSNLQFIYDASGNRIAKIVIPDTTDPSQNTVTWYSRDASGNVMAIYKSTYDSTATGITEEIHLIERPIYGSSRVGEQKDNILIKTIDHPTSGTPTEVANVPNTRITESTNMSIGVQKPLTITSQTTQNGLQTIILSPITGAKQEVNFSTPASPQVSATNALFGFGIQGSNICVVEDNNGGVVFSAYTAKQIGATNDVCRVLDASNNIMSIPLSNPIKSNWLGKSLGIKKPGSTNIYYLITVGTDQLAYYHVINTTTGVVDPNHQIPGTNYGYGMALIEDESAGAASKLYLRKYNSNDTADIVTVTITSGGFGTPTVAASFSSKDAYGRGEIQIAPDGTKLAIANQKGSSAWWTNIGEIKVYNLDANHDIASLNTTLSAGDFSSLQSLDFSPTSEHVYYNRQSFVNLSPSNGNDIKQFNIATLHDTIVIAGTNGDVRRAKDDNMYVASGNQTDLQKITNPDASFAVSSYTVATTPWKTTIGIPLQAHKILIFDNDYITRELKLKTYEINDHLGNVRAVISDLKESTLNGGVPEDYEPDIVAINNYYAFGSLMPGRHFGGSDYRYGFNGKESDGEVYNSTGTSYDYGFRIYNSRLARFLSVDPLTKSYPWYTPYQFAGNKPILYVDLDGKEESLQWMKAFATGFGKQMQENSDGIVSHMKLVASIVAANSTLCPTGDCVFTEGEKAAAYLVSHPKELKKIVQEIIIEGGQSLSNFGDKLAEGDGESFGRLSAEIALLAFPGDEVAKAARIETKITSKIANEVLDGFLVNSSKRLDDVLKAAAPGRKTKGKTELLIKNGGLKKAYKDFDALELDNIKTINTPAGKIKTGKLFDGREVTVRPKSSDGRPTLEIRAPKNNGKKGRGQEVRYNK